MNATDRNADDICRALVGESLRLRSKSNITCLIVFFSANGLPKVRPVRGGSPQVPMKEAPKPPVAMVQGMKEAFLKWKAEKQ